MRVIIAGGGIGGLAAAIALKQQGIAVTVYEQVPGIHALGVGINLLPHAVGVLKALGLGDALAASAVDAQELVFMNRHGQEILADPRGLAAGYAYPQYSIHRGELQMILYRAASAAIGEDNIRTGCRVAAFEQPSVSATRVNSARSGNSVKVRLVDRDTGAPKGSDEADVLIAADGIHSAIRAQLYPDEGPPKWNGVQMWRGVTEGMPFLSGRSQIWSGSNRQKFVCYPISKPHMNEGRALINWIADLRMDGQSMPPREDWNRPGKLADFLPRYENWKFPCLDVPAVIRNAGAIFEFPMVDRDPLDRWSFGRVTLLGDAAHPMYPIGSNGASQAILDAEAIAAALSESSRSSGSNDPDQALIAYQAKRLPMAASIVHLNRKQGLDVILDIVEARAPNGFADINDVVPRAELEAIVGRYKQVAGHQQTAKPA